MRCAWRVIASSTVLFLESLTLLDAMEKQIRDLQQQVLGSGFGQNDDRRDVSLQNLV
jgi:hypothetical protein